MKNKYPPIILKDIDDKFDFKIKSNEVILINGRKRYGKTTMLKKLIDSNPDYVYIIYDITVAFSTIGFSFIHGKEALLDKLKYMKSIPKHEFEFQSFVYKPKDYRSENDFVLILSIAEQFNCILVIDELTTLATNGISMDALDSFILGSRHSFGADKENGCILVTHKIKGITTTLNRDQIDRFILFRTKAKSDSDFFTEEGFNRVEQLKTLLPGEFIIETA